jgi:hypothetical protein
MSTSDGSKDARLRAHRDGIAQTLRAFFLDKITGRQSTDVAAEIVAAMRDRLEANDTQLGIAEVGLAAEVIMGQAGTAPVGQTQIERLRHLHPGFDSLSAVNRAALADADTARQTEGERPLPNSIAAILMKPEASRTAMENWKIAEFENGGGAPNSSPVPKVGAVKIVPGDPLANLRALRSAEMVARLRRDLDNYRRVADTTKDGVLRLKAASQVQNVTDALIKAGGDPNAVEG